MPLTQPLKVLTQAQRQKYLKDGDLSVEGLTHR